MEFDSLEAARVYLVGLMEDECTGTDVTVYVQHDGETCPIHED